MVNATFKAFRSSADLSGIAANQYAKYTYRKENFCKNIGVFFNRVGYFLSRGTRITNEKMIRCLINYVDSTADAANNGTPTKLSKNKLQIIGPNTKVHLKKVAKIYGDLIGKIHDPALKATLDNDYQAKLQKYNQAIGAKNQNNTQRSARDSSSNPNPSNLSASQATIPLSALGSINVEVNGVKFAFDNAKFLYSEPYYSDKDGTVSFKYEYCCSLSTKDKITYVLSITRPKTTQFVAVDTTCATRNSPIAYNGYKFFYFGHPSDDKLIESFTLSKGKQYQFNIETHYGFIEKTTRTATFSMTLPN